MPTMNIIIPERISENIYTMDELSISPSLAKFNFNFDFLRDEEMMDEEMSVADYEAEVEVEIAEVVCTAVATSVPIIHARRVNSVDIPYSPRHSTPRSGRWRGSSQSSTSSTDSDFDSPSRSSNEETRSVSSASSIGSGPSYHYYADRKKEIVTKQMETTSVFGIPTVTASVLPATPAPGRPSSTVDEQHLMPWESQGYEPEYITLPILISDLADVPTPSPAPLLSPPTRRATSPYTTALRAKTGYHDLRQQAEKDHRVVEYSYSPFAADSRLSRSLSRLVRPSIKNAPATTTKAPEELGKYRMVRIPRDEYFRYWARDPSTGRYAGVEPEGQGLERLRMGLGGSGHRMGVEWMFGGK